MSLLEKTKMNASRKSWPISLVIFIVWLSFIVGGGLLQIKGHHIQLERLVEKQIMFGELVEIVFLTGVITYLRWWPQVGWKCPNNFRDLRLLWPPALSLLFMLMIVLCANLPSFSVLMIVIINTLMVGINEELMFRGILFYGASSSFGIWRAVWITAIIFGSVHILNSLITGDFRDSILQAFFAGTFGIWAAALRIRLNTIIPVIIIHWFWDCLAFLANSIWDLALLPFSLILFIYGLWLLRNYRRGEIELLRDKLIQ
jgi:hypothetical protein